MITLHIRHLMPEVQFFTGRWTIKDRGVMLYFYDNKEIFYVQPSKKALEYVETDIVKNRKYIGEYSKDKNSIIYKINLDEHNLVLDSIPKLTNYIRLRLVEEITMQSINIKEKGV